MLKVEMAMVNNKVKFMRDDVEVTRTARSTALLIFYLIAM